MNENDEITTKELAGILQGQECEEFCLEVISISWVGIPIKCILPTH